MRRSAWVAQVDRRLKHDWSIDLAGIGFDDVEIERLWLSGEAPDAFVERIAEKYNLSLFEPLRV